VNVLEPDLTAHSLVQVSTFAFLLKNLVRQTGLQKLSGGVHLNGTGMAFPWPVFRDAELATADVVEDLGLGLSLASAGRRPLFVSGAQVWSPPASLGGTKLQRTRWEGGFLATARRRGLPLIAASLARGDWRSAWLGIDLLIPPLALLACINVILFAAGGLTVFGGGSVTVLGLFAIAAFSACAAISLVWARFGRNYLSARALLSFPVYVVWKLPMYVLLAVRGSPRRWLRSGR
jgi:cellulose synthase/poly-beta-1,6-N-acetylglucosamine synthase-like glycosyltransferase